MKIHKHTCPRPNVGDEINDWFWVETLGPKISTSKVNDMLVGIGTVLSNKLPSGCFKHVLGSGTGYDNKGFRLDDTFKVHFVRGPLTAQKLGLPNNKWITDPAVIISLLRPVKKPRDIPVSFMPHVGIDSQEYKDLIEGIGWNYISPSENADQVFDQIARSEKLITSAMHGAIFADSYRTPWFPVTTSKEILDFKWQDWTSSMDLKYKPVKLPAYWNCNNTFMNRTKSFIKGNLITTKLQGIALKEQFNLSKDSVFKEKVDQIDTHLNKFKSAYL